MTEDHCVVCFNKHIKIFSIGECDHPVCYVCSARMRVLCSQNECPICRYDMSVVVFTEKVQQFKNLSTKYALVEEEYKIAFDNAYIQNAYKFLFINVCKKCCNHPIFDDFDELQNHMQHKHKLYCCKLCVKDLKIFSKEHRWYTKTELARHRVDGDQDDTSHRGHPLCRFCEIRFLDNDELYRHLRRNHFYCHICDAEGVQGFYSDYRSLRDHFKSEHHLCEEGNCANEQFTSVFSSLLALQAHHAVTHSRNAGRRGERFGHLEIQITLIPRPGDRIATNIRTRNEAHHQETVTDESQQQEQQQQQQQQRREQQIVQRPRWLDSTPSLEQAFPVLGSGPVVPMQRPTTFVKKNRLAFTDQNFPALSSELSSSAPSTSSTSAMLVTANVNNNGNAIPTTSVSYTSSTVRMNQPKAQKKRVVNSLHINPSSNDNNNNHNNNAVNKNNNNNNSGNVSNPSSASSSRSTGANWALKMKSAPTMEKKQSPAGASSSSNKNSNQTSAVTLHKQEFPALGAGGGSSNNNNNNNNNNNSKKQNKKSSVTMQIGNAKNNLPVSSNNSNSKNNNNPVNNNNNSNGNSKKLKMPQSNNSATDERVNIVSELSSNQKKVKMKSSPDNVKNDCNSTSRAAAKDNDSAAAKGGTSSKSDNAVNGNRNSAHTTTAVADNAKAKKKCSLVPLINDEQNNNNTNTNNNNKDSILINFHSHNRNNKQKNANGDNNYNNNVNNSDASKTNNNNNLSKQANKSRNAENAENVAKNSKSSSGWAKLTEQIKLSNKPDDDNTKGNNKSQNDRKKPASSKREKRNAIGNTVDQDNIENNIENNNNKSSNSMINGHNDNNNKLKKTTGNKINNNDTTAKSKINIPIKIDGTKTNDEAISSSQIENIVQKYGDKLPSHSKTNFNSNRKDDDILPPPGLSSRPPGLSAPPGFTRVVTTGNNLTFTNSQGQSYSMHNKPSETNYHVVQQPNSSSSSSFDYVYKQPPNFYARNKQLLDSVAKALTDSERLKDFQNTSLLYRDNFLTGPAYYAYCKSNIRSNLFDNIFVDLVVLLPDLFKQRELWSAYCADRLPQSIKSFSRITVCTKCGQILTIEDADIHYAEHTL